MNLPNDSFTETTTTSWLGRIGNAIKGIVFGGILFLVAFPVLFFNEGRAVHTAQMLAEGASTVVSVPAEKIDESNEGKLVHISGETAVKDELRDEEFGISAKAVRLLRKVEMYQWEQKESSKTEKNLGGSSTTTTTYTYNKVWNDEVINSSSFKQPGHENPSQMSISSRPINGKDVTVGAFVLPDEMVAKLSNYSPVDLGSEAVSKVSKAMQSKVKISDNHFFIGADPANPAVGDLRVGFAIVQTGPVSIVAGQHKNTFEHYHTRAGNGDLLLIVSGTQSSQQMFAQEQAHNRTLTWILRFVGFFLMTLGIFLVLKPLAVLADVLPILGDILEAGVFVIALGISATLSLVTIAIGWLVYRPLVGILFLLIAAGIAYLAHHLIHQKRTARIAAAAAN